MVEKLKQILQLSPANFTEMRHSQSSGTSILISKGEVETCLNAHNSSGSVRTFNNGGIGFCAFNNDDFATGLQKSLESTLINGTVERSLVKTIPIKDKIENSIIVDPQKLTLEEKFDFVKKIHDLLNKSNLSSTIVEFKNYTKDLLYLSSNGSEIHQRKHFTGMRISVSMKNNNTLQRAYFSEGTFGGMENLEPVEQQISVITKRVSDLAKAPKIDSGKYRVLLNQNLAGVFAHEAFGHMSEADFLADNPELHEKIALGTVLGVEDLNITDDGQDSSLCGWCAYDDEGVSAQRRELIKNGKVSCYLQSRLTAYDMNMKPTGNGRALSPFYAPIPRMTNTYIENGFRSFDSLLEELWDGIYACDMIGGMTNLEMFTFSSAYAYRVEKGKIMGLVRDVVLSGTLFETMKNIIGIGNDLQHHGGLGGCGKSGQNGLPVSTGSPHLLIKDVLIG